MVLRSPAAAKLAAAAAAPAVAAAPARTPKANTTGLASRVMPLKKGGLDQLHNLQALAGRRQVIFAIGTHPSSTDTTALHPLPAAAAANLAAAGIPGAVRPTDMDIRPRASRARASVMSHAEVAAVPGSHGGFNRIGKVNERISAFIRAGARTA